MLAQKYRLTLDNNIKRVMKSGRPFLTKFINFKITENNLEHSRFCIIISGKVDKRAVVRNRIKRQISEALRFNMNKIKSGYDVVILVKSTIMDKETKKIAYNYHEIERNILWALGRLKLLSQLNIESVKPT
jgi:ribonuclease P protein component